MANTGHATIEKAQEKFERGVLNIALSWWEFPYQIYEEMKKNPKTGIPIGFGKSAYMIPLRVVTGAVDFVTFPVPFPVKDYGPMFEPEINPWID